MRKAQLGAAAPTSPHSQVNSAVFRLHGGKRALNSAAPAGSGYRRATTVTRGPSPQGRGPRRRGDPDFSPELLRRTVDETGKLELRARLCTAANWLTRWGRRCNAKRSHSGLIVRHRPIRTAQDLLTTAHSDVTELNLVRNGHRPDALLVTS